MSNLEEFLMQAESIQPNSAAAVNPNPLLLANHPMAHVTNARVLELAEDDDDHVLSMTFAASLSTNDTTRRPNT